MKSERRHELEKNTLANWLGENADRVKPYANTILGALLVVVLLFLVWTWWSGHSVSASAQAWNELHAAMQKSLSTQNAEDLDAVVEKYPGAKAALWAAVTAGDLRLGFAAESRFSNKAVADDELKAAVENYLYVLDETKDGTLRERAAFGLARAYETQGNVDKAVACYKEQVIQAYPDGVYKAIAQQRLTFLESPAGKEFYTKFAQFKPEPALADEPGTPGVRPDFSLDSLDAPSTTTPAEPAAATPAEPAPSTEPAAPAEPAGGDAPK